MRQPSKRGRLNRVGGVSLPYAVWGEGTGKRMVFAHALTGTGAGFGDAYGPLLDDGWTVAALDQRGHAGASPSTDPGHYTPQAMGGDLIALLDELGWETAWLGGGSMGTAPALCAAVASGHRVEGLVLMAPAFSDEPNDAAQDFADIARAVGGEGLEAGKALWKERFLARGVAPEATAQHLAQLELHDPGSLACWLGVIGGWTLRDEIAAVAQLKMPVLVMSWNDDPIHPFALGKQFAALAPRGSFAEIDMTAGSNPLFETAAKMLAPYR